MREITEVKIGVNSQVVTQIKSLNEIKKILKLIGKNYEKYYF
jgi:hypothetical protein